MGKDFQIREAKLGDLEQLKALYQQLNPTDAVNSDGREVDTLNEILSSTNFHIFLLCDGPIALSTTYLNVIPNLTRGGAPYAVVENVVTAEHARRQGLGKRLMQHTLEFAWKRGCYKVMLLTGSKREAVHGFYRECGFDGDAKHGFIVRRH